MKRQVSFVCSDRTACALCPSETRTITATASRDFPRMNHKPDQRAAPKENRYPGVRSWQQPHARRRPCTAAAPHEPVLIVSGTVCPKTGCRPARSLGCFRTLWPETEVAPEGLRPRVRPRRRVCAPAPAVNRHCPRRRTTGAGRLGPRLQVRIYAPASNDGCIREFWAQWGGVSPLACDQCSGLHPRERGPLTRSGQRSLRKFGATLCPPETRTIRARAFGHFCR